VRNSSDVPIDNNRGTTLTFDSEDFDNAGIHSTTTTTARFSG